jgi:hypothetical protein
MSLSQFTQSEIEQYYRIRLDRAGFHHVKGNEWRSRCILHGGDNPNSLWVDIATGGFCCFSCQKKGGGIYSFEQEVLRGESASGQAPETGKVTESIHTVLGTPFVSRVYQEDIPTKAKGTGWDRKQAQDYYVYQDELGRELYRVWRFVDRSGNKVTPVRAKGILTPNVRLAVSMGGCGVPKTFGESCTGYQTLSSLVSALLWKERRM